MVREPDHEAEGMPPIRKAGLATGWSADDRFSTALRAGFRRSRRRSFPSEGVGLI